MIEAASLRIGNNVSVGGEMIIIESIYLEKRTNKYKIGFREQAEQEYADVVDGIAITPEVLKWYAFMEMETEEYGLVNRDFKVFVDNGRGTCKYYYGEAPEERTLHFLHELQNLYYCLSGEELIDATPDEAFKR